MALIDTVRRLARLGFYFGLGTVTAVLDACGGGSLPPADVPDGTAETAPDVSTSDEATSEDDATAADEATAEDDAAAPDEASPDDGAADDGEDLWDIVCE